MKPVLYYELPRLFHKFFSTKSCVAKRFVWTVVFKERLNNSSNFRLLFQSLVTLYTYINLYPNSSLLFITFIVKPS